MARQLAPALCRSIIDKIHQPQWAGNYFYNTYTYDSTRDIRTQHTYQLDVTETVTHLTFDLLVKTTEASLTKITVDSTVLVGPTFTTTISKDEIGWKHTLSFVYQPFPEQNPELVTYFEFKKGAEDDNIYLRYANSEEELAKENYVALNRQ